MTRAAKPKMQKIFAYVRLLADYPGGLSDYEAVEKLTAKGYEIGVTDIYRYRKNDLADCVAQKLNRYGNPVFGKYTLIASKPWLEFAQAIIRAMSRSNE